MATTNNATEFNFDPATSGAPPGPPWKTYTDTQRRALANAPKATALLSILGSAWIIYDLVFRRDDKGRRGRLLGTTYNRIILCMSLVDLLSSAWLFVGIWAVDPDSVGPILGPKLRAVGAMGSQATCNAQGFFIQLGMASPMYNVSLALYSLLVVRYGWKESRIKRQASKFMLSIPVLFGLVTAIPGIPLELYNYTPVGMFCWTSPFPIICESWGGSDDRYPECIRGEGASAFRLAVAFTPVCICFLVMAICMIMVYHKVWYLEKKSKTKWDFQRKQRKNRKKRSSAEMSKDQKSGSLKGSLEGSLKSLSREGSLKSLNSSFGSLGDSRTFGVRPERRKRTSKARKVAVQALYFISAFFLAWSLYIILSSMSINPKEAGLGHYFWLNIFANFLFPAQGFFNCMVFMRPRYVNFRERNPKWNIRSVIYRTLRKAVSQDPDNCGDHGKNNKNDDLESGGGGELVLDEKYLSYIESTESPAPVQKKKIATNVNEFDLGGASSMSSLSVGEIKEPVKEEEGPSTNTMISSAAGSEDESSVESSIKDVDEEAYEESSMEDVDEEAYEIICAEN